jgi:hypothetical protein
LLEEDGSDNLVFRNFLVLILDDDVEKIDDFDLRLFLVRENLPGILK